ncbi:hypothetical protein [Frigoriglobus tundricola]|uniref:Death on curing protein, Doc toxin n=1 Tax=Frigoriglobus tundricola TaxID=2774151 RepID=A0A6M5YN36_9BACT|nr:hypothetical protein [Frigoriglobus tundricola]QJW94362.1 hypothetical protein FTUN_1882 [Frigoriglobus tundricola]
MNYRVVARRSVSNNIRTATFLAYELGRDGSALIRGAEEIQLALSDNPAEQGESREGNERVIIAHPLTATYEVFEAAQVVLIYSAVYYPRQRL